MVSTTRITSILLITILQSSHSLTRKKWQTSDAAHLRKIQPKQQNKPSNSNNPYEYERNISYRSNQMLKAKQMAAANYRRNKAADNDDNSALYGGNQQRTNQEYRSHLNQSYQAYVQSQCPTGCVCHTNNLIRCTFKFFTRVPGGLPIDVEQLNT